MASDDRLIAARYVQALFDLASEGGQHDQVKVDMQALEPALKIGEFEKLLASPIISREDSADTIAKVLATMEASELTQRFFALLARNRRLPLAAIVVETYLARLAASRNELTAEVTSAQGLSEDETAALMGAIAKSTGKKVTIKARENPALLGGLQVRVGSRLLDNSVAGKLERLKQLLSAA